MAKPICVIFYNKDFDKSQQTYREIADFLDNKMPDYHVFFLPKHDNEETLEFKVFHEKDFTEIQYQELRQLVENAIEEIKTI